jgi:hypothetical protein
MSAPTSTEAKLAKADITKAVVENVRGGALANTWGDSPGEE